MLYFGIDWSEKYHDVCILNEAGARVSQFRVNHSLVGFERIEAERRKLGVAPSECLVGIETAHNLVVDFLLERGYGGVYIIPPQATPNYRGRHRSSGAHTDRSDAALLAEVVRSDRQHHRRLQPNSALTSQMLVQVRLIETLRRSIQRQSNQLRAMLLRAYPQAVGLFGELTAQISLRLLNAYPTVQEAQRLSLADFTAFCKQHQYTRTGLIRKRYVQLLEPSPEAAPAVAQAYREPIRTLAEVLLPQVQHRRQAIQNLGELFHQHPDAFIFDTLPGAGDILAPSLLVKFGDHREAFPRPGDVQALAGTCPVTLWSGKKKTIRFRHGCDKEFRRITQQFSMASIAQSGWASGYWHEVYPRCTSKAHATRCLGNRWLAIIWKLWQTRQPYDEAYHLRQCVKRKRPKTEDQD